MKARRYFLGMVATLAALPALAADIDGKWNATADGPTGPVQLVFEFKAEGEKLNGALSMDMLPAPAPISDGVVKGNDVTFKLELAMMEGAPPLVINYKGTVKGDELNLTSLLDFGQGPMESVVVAKRAK